MTLTIRSKNLILGGSLGAFAFGIFAYTVHQMQKDDLSELEALDKPIKVNVHQSGAYKAAKESK
ncbi:unnamed protein product [Albugo candida]|uniref:Cytochrome c oxidase assembly factor 3 mitochondrial coiled-coil domain-containing protein n=1 Tax=Albugo candida TaxID=65357 RepID=A0A024GCD1_9STRA|nr:unnamed protein product [Albugo candida]|eukprot:CCI43982.1 unnamed protein product [Albugo candida]